MSKNISLDYIAKVTGKSKEFILETIMDNKDEIISLAYLDTEPKLYKKILNEPQAYYLINKLKSLDIY